MTNVLIVSTRYDHESAITRNWAAVLSGELLNHGVVNILVDGTVLNAAALQDLSDFADYFVFFGHGTSTSLVAHPNKGGTDLDLVDETAAQTLFADCVVYAVCCDALQAFGANCPKGFIGYGGAFPIKEQLNKEFCDVVASSVVSLVFGNSLAAVVTNTAQSWRNLADDFDQGRLKNHPDKAWGKTTAEGLANSLGREP